MKKQSDVSVYEWLNIRGLSIVELMVVVFSLVLVFGVFGSRQYFTEQSKVDEIVFSAASSLASGVWFAHQQWRKNGHQDGDAIDDLQGFRRDNFNMTFNGWPRGLTEQANHTNMSVSSCQEIWMGLVDDRWQDDFQVSAESGSLGLCRFTSVGSDGVVEYDVKRGRVVLTMG